VSEHKGKKTVGGKGQDLTLRTDPDPVHGRGTIPSAKAIHLDAQRL
jgi:hypothetical protein